MLIKLIPDFECDPCRRDGRVDFETYTDCARLSAVYIVYRKYHRQIMARRRAVKKSAKSEEEKGLTEGKTSPPPPTDEAPADDDAHAAYLRCQGIEVGM